MLELELWPRLRNGFLNFDCFLESNFDLIGKSRADSMNFHPILPAVVEQLNHRPISLFEERFHQLEPRNRQVGDRMEAPSLGLIDHAQALLDLANAYAKTVSGGRWFTFELLGNPDASRLPGLLTSRSAKGEVPVENCDLQVVEHHPF